MRNDGCSAARYTGFIICGLVFGIPALLFLSVLTWGAILIPVAGVLMLAPLGAINSLLSGLWASGGTSRAQLTE